MITQPLSSPDEEILSAITQTQAQAILDRDWTAWCAACADDLVLFPPNEESVEGHDAVVSWLESLPRVSTLHATVEDILVEGDVAFTRSSSGSCWPCKSTRISDAFLSIDIWVIQSLIKVLDLPDSFNSLRKISSFSKTSISFSFKNDLIFSGML